MAKNTATCSVLLTVALLLPTLASGAGPVYWDWPTERPFSELELSGAAVDGDGFLVAGLSARAEGPEGPEVFWKAAADGRGGFYTGTGHGGEVHHTSAAGKSRLVVRLECTEIFSLMVLPDGDLLAGSGPEGHLYRISPSGENRIVGTVPGGYVWSLYQTDATAPVWVASGSPAGLFRYDPEADDFVEQLQLPAENMLDVGQAPGGGLLLVTQGPGLIYQYKPDGKPRLLYETPQDEARQIVVGPEGAAYVLALHAETERLPGLAGRSAGAQPAPPAALMPLLGLDDTPTIAPATLYLVHDDGVVEPWWSGQTALMIAAWSPRWGWLGGGPLDAEGGHAELYRLTAPRGAHTLARWAGGDVLDILVPDTGGDELIVCQAHPGAVFRLGAEGDQALVALSAPLDGGQPVKWGRLTWSGSDEGGRLKWSVRGGNRSEPDESWTEWSKTWTDHDHELALAPSRFIQWRVEFPVSKSSQSSGRVTQVAVSAWQDNQAPVIAEFQLEQLVDVRLGGMLGASDNVTQRFRSGLQAEFSHNAVRDDWAGPLRGAVGRTVRIFTWQGSDPNNDRVTYRLDYRLAGETAWRPLSIGRLDVFETVETLASWDTSEAQDGVYDLRLTASDDRDNPAPLARQSERILGPVVVDNTAPEITKFAARLSESGFAVSCQVEDLASAVAGAQLVLPDGSRERIDPVDMICDSQREKFALDVAWPRDGQPAGPVPWRVRFEVRDVAGNAHSVEDAAR